MVMLSLIAVLAVSVELSDMVQWPWVWSSAQWEGGFSHLAEMMEEGGSRLCSSNSRRSLGSEGWKEKGTAGAMIGKPLSLMMAEGEKPSAKTEQIFWEHIQSTASFEFSWRSIAPFWRRVTSSMAIGSSAGGSRPVAIALASSRIEDMLMSFVAEMSMSISTCLD